MIPEARDRVNVLIALLRNTQAELVRYRDKEWQITAYIVAIELTFAGSWPFAGLSTKPGVWYRVLSCAFLMGVGAVGVYFLGYVHERLNAARVTYSTILFRLGLDEILTDGTEADSFQFSSDRGPASELLRPRWR